MNRHTSSYFTTFFMQGTGTEERQGWVKKRAAESDSLTIKSRNTLPWDMGMEYFSPVMMPIHWAEFYADLKKCQEEKDLFKQGVDKSHDFY